MDETMWRAMCKCCITGRPTQLRDLVAQGGDVSGIPGLLTPLFWATCFVQMECVTYLVEQGANVHATWTKNENVLMSTVKYYNKVPHIINHQAIPIEQSLTILRMLLQAGADVHAPNAEGKTALQMAKNPAVKALLLEYADPQRVEKVAETHETQP